MYVFICSIPIGAKIYKKIVSIKQAIATILITYFTQILIAFLLTYVNNLIPNLDVEWATYMLPIFRLGDFIIGCCLGYIFIHKKSNLNMLVASFVEIIVFMYAVFCHYIYVHKIGLLGTDNFRYTIIFTFSSVVLVYLFAIKKGIVSKFITCKPVIWLGNISAYAFLIHYILVRYTLRLPYFLYHSFNINMNINIYVLSAILFIATILLSALYKTIDNKIRQKFIKK